MQLPSPSSFGGDSTGLTPDFLELMGGVFPEMVALIGKRTGELHCALACRVDDTHFSPEPFTLLYQRSLFQSMRSRARKVTEFLRRNLARIPETIRSEAENLVKHEQEILGHLHKITVHKFDALKTRTHGDYHLGQLLFAGDDFYVVDFEGEPTLTLSERRLRHSPLRDVAGMMNSFYYAAYAVLLKSGQVRSEDVDFLEPWAKVWYRYNSGVFLTAYLAGIGQAAFLPESREDVETMLYAFMLDKAMYEVGYEMNNRPDWLPIPLRGITGLLSEKRIGGEADDKIPTPGKQP